MLSKSKRINLKKEFKWVALGKKLDAKYLKLFLREGDNKTSRVGIAVSSHIFKKAVQRNRARRLISYAFQSTTYHLPPAINIVALPKKGIIEVKSEDVLLDLEGALRKERII